MPKLIFERWGELRHHADAHCAYIDVDQRRSPDINSFFVACRIVGLRPVWTEYYRTRRGWHVRIYLRDPMQPAELVALQAVCGSDNRRETLNLMRVFQSRRNRIRSRFWRDRWNLLYKRKLK